MGVHPVDRANSVVRRVSLTNADWVLPQCVIDNFPHVDAVDCCTIECGICLGDFETGSSIVQLPCKHCFHDGCANQWLAQCMMVSKATCPLCRTPVAANPEKTRTVAANE